MVLTVRYVVLVLSLIFVGGMAGLTIDDFVTNGVTGLGIVGAGVVIVCGIGILGALLQRPRR